MLNAPGCRMEEAGMLEYSVFKKEDVSNFYYQLVFLMEMVLKDNILQSYPDTLPIDYVNNLSVYIEDGSAYIVGAKDGESLAGFSWAYELKIFNEKRFHIDMICVDPGYRKKGIAGKFVKLQIDEAKRRGIKSLEAMATRGNENAYHWFHSLGFEDERVKVKLEI